MTQIFAYAGQGLGAFVRVSDAGQIMWIGLFGHDTNGNDLVLSGARGNDGSFRLERRSRPLSLAFPNVEDHITEIAGTCNAQLKDYDNQLVLSYAVDMGVLGVDLALDFSPPVESPQTGQLTLFRL